MRSRAILTCSAGFVLLLCLSQLVSTQQPGLRTSGGDWPMYRRDLAGTGYSPLAQIDRTNVLKLTQTWSYSLAAAATAEPTTGRGGATGPNSEVTPIVVNGVMYLTTANRVVALEPETGKEIWQHVITGAPPSRRGVAYWPGDGALAPRVLVTSGRRLLALNAATGASEPSFGQQGEIDLAMPSNSVPLVFRNAVIVGANTPPPPATQTGNARAFDARSGAKLWEFNSIPQPGTAGHDSWEGDSWQGRPGVNAWSFYFTLDEQRGVVYIPLSSASPGNYGGDRKGANLYANSLVAIDAQSGAYKWHFQTIHHDLWDADPAAPPGLFDIVQNGRTIPVAALTTKSGYMYLLNRETGQPIFGVEERGVPSSQVPGEASSPTQPIPVKPAPIARTSYGPADLVTAADTTPEHVKACEELIQKSGGVTNAGPFTPWPLRTPGASTPATVLFPGMLGGANWGGTSFDPTSGLVYVVTQDEGSIGWMEKGTGTQPAYVKNGPERTGSFEVPMTGGNWPCQRPPWGQLTAIKAATGDIAWRMRLGTTDGLPPDRQRTGRPAVAGPITTAGGLVFVAATDDNRFRAFDARLGRELWVAKLEKRGNANPMTFQGRNGKQYVAVVATDTLVAFALP